MKTKQKTPNKNQTKTLQKQTKPTKTLQALAFVLQKMFPFFDF